MPPLFARSSRRTLPATLAILAALPALARAQDSVAAPAPGAAPARATRTMYLPVVGSAPETGLQLGATAYRISRPPLDSTRRPTVTQLYAIVTTKSQFRTFLEHDRWSAGNATRLLARVQFERFPQPFYGYGADAPEAAEEIYTPRTLSGAVSWLRRRATSGLYTGVSWRGWYTDIAKADSGGLIASNQVTGAEGGAVAQLEGNVVYDTRDNVFAAAGGTYVQFTGAVARPWTLSEYDFGRLTLDARTYRSWGRNVFAGQLLSDNIVSGDAPFDQVAMFGTANSMRAYVRGRYRDDHLLALQGEWRRPVAGRLDLAAFAGVGTVADEFDRLGKSTWLPTMGLGVRYAVFPKERARIRIDLGFGRDATGLYIALNEAF
jgi:outer membrane protein assembly factor BamA